MNSNFIAKETAEIQPTQKATDLGWDPAAEFPSEFMGWDGQTYRTWTKVHTEPWEGGSVTYLSTTGEAAIKDQPVEGMGLVADDLKLVVQGALLLYFLGYPKGSYLEDVA